MAKIYFKNFDIKKAEEVDENFHARFNVKAKEYIYKINMGEYDPLERNYVYQHNKKLDVVEMERAMKYLEGTHNFKSFTKTDEEKAAQKEAEKTAAKENLRTEEIKNKIVVKLQNREDIKENEVAKGVKFTVSLSNMEQTTKQIKPETLGTKNDR